MQTTFSEDQIQFREVVTRFLQEKSQPTATRRLLESETGFDAGVWSQLAGEVGLAGTHVPETHGGFGFGPIELGITAEEMGRHLYAGPFFASAVMATYALLHIADNDARDEYLPGIAAGETLATLALDSLDGPEHVGQQITASGDALSGAAPLVVDATVSDLLVVIAGDALYAVPTSATGISIEPVTSLDPTRRLARVGFDGVAASRIGDVDSVSLNRTWDHICVALAHEMVGGAQYLLDSTIEYTKMRYQFGRPIGSFQGLKHRCADLLTEVEWAKATAHYAARCLDAGEGEPYIASMAKAMASDTYIKAAKEAIQMRGGIGFTWEEDTQLWYKRAKSSEVFMGTPSYHRERMMTMIEEGAA